MAEYVINNKANEPLGQVKVGIATDMRGVPLMYRYYAGNVSDMDMVKNLADDIRSYGKEDALFVIDRGFCNFGPLSDVQGPETVGSGTEMPDQTTILSFIA